MSFRSVSSLSVVILLFFLQNMLNAQEKYTVRSYTTSDGLAYNTVQSICQDRNGFYWIATGDGLSRFDGYDFKNFFHIPEDTASFPFFSLDKVLVDSRNNVWVFSEGKVPAIYDRVHDNFHRINFPAGKSAEIGDIIYGTDSCIWISVKGALARHDGQTPELSWFSLVDNDGYQPIITDRAQIIGMDNHGKLWLFCSKNNIFRVYGETNRTPGKIYFSFAGSLSIGNSVKPGLRNSFPVFAIYTGSQGDTYFFTKYGLFLKKSSASDISSITGKPDLNEIGGNHFFIWADDQDNMRIFDAESKTISVIKTGSKTYLESAYFDKFGNLWTGEVNQAHENEGLKRYSRIPQYFRNYLPGISDLNSPLLVFPIAGTSDHSLWVGTRNLDYLLRLSTAGNTEKFYIENRGGVKSKSKARCLIGDSAYLWIGTDGDQLLRYAQQTGRVSLMFPTSLKDSALGELVFHNIIKSGDDLVINGGSAVYRFETKSGRMVRGYSFPRSGTAFSIAEDRTGGYWVGMWGNSILRLNSNLEQIFSKRLGSEGNIIQNICPGDSNDLWLAMQGGGLGHYYIKSGRYEVFSTSSGLPNNVLYSILKDKQGQLWISTNDGISKFNPATRKFRNYGIKDGLLIREFDSGSFYQSAEGEMFFGGVGGFVGFYPDSVCSTSSGKIHPDIIVTELNVSGKSKKFDKPLYMLDTFRLSRGDNNFQLTVACLNLEKPELTGFRYRLSGENTDWTESDAKNRTVSYINLTHEVYSLEIETKTEENAWSGKKTFHIEIPDRFFEIIWVRILIAILVILSLSAAVTLYIQNLKYKSKQKHDELRLSSLRGQMNPHFIFNSLNSINYFIASENKRAANDYIADFSRLMRAILNNMEADYIPMDKEIESISDYLKLEQMRFTDKLEYVIESSGLEDIEQLYVIPGLVQPFIENAVWHGIRPLEDRRGIIRVSYGRGSRNHVVCIIEDDGIGRKLASGFSGKNARHKSRGTEIALERIAIINRALNTNFKITINDLYSEKEETGTRVIVELPVRSG
jgi:streptogramin lyase